MKCVGPPGGDPCGADLDPGNKFCPNCGTAVKLSTIVECESRTVCTNIIDGRECGATLLPTHNFCPGCGEKKTNGNFRVEKVQGTEINQPTVEVEVMPKRTSDSETPSRPKKIKVDEELHVDMSQVKYPPSMQNKDENMAEEHHHHLRPGCSANDSSQVSGISSGSSKAPVTSSDSRQAPGTPSGSSDEPGKSSGSPLTTGTPSGASQEPGTSNGSSQVTGTSSGSSQATCTPSGLSQTPVTSSDSRQGPGTSSDSSQEPGTSGGSSQVTGISSGSSQEPGKPSGSSQVTGTSSGSSQEPGKPSGSSQEPGTSGGSLHEPGTSGGSLQEPGTSSGSSQTTGRSVSSSQEPGTSSTSSQFTGTDVTSKDVHEGTLGVSSSDGKRVTSNRNPNTNAGIFTMQHNATSSTSDKEGKVFGEGNKGDISTENDKKTNNTTEQPSTSSLPQENEDVGSPVDEPQRDTQEMATTAESDNRIGGEMINKKNQEPDNYVPATKGNSKKGKNKGKNVNTQKSRNSNEAEISVHFHVIMSPDVAFDQQKDTFVMKLSPEELGGFSFTSGAGGWVLLKERDLPDGLKMYQVVVPIKIENLRGSKFVSYKYVIRRQKNDKIVAEWEMNFGHGRGEHKNRALSVPDGSLKSGGIWHQYDGMAFFGKETFTSQKSKFWEKGWHTVKSWFVKDNLSDTTHGRFLMTSKTALSHMMPSWEGFVVDGTGKKGSAHEAVDGAYQVLYSMRSRFVNSNGHYDLHLLKQAFLEYVQPRLDKCKYEKIKSETAEEGELRVAAVAAILYIIVSLDMPQDEKGDKAESLSSSLFEGLFLLPEKNGKCESFQKLVEVHFPQEKQKVLIKGLEGLIKQFAGGNVKNPKWLLAIPLYHFLCGHSKPFARVDINEKHNHDSGKWWGIENIKKAVESFKKAMEYSRQGTSMMDRLVPLFKMDKLLPRTFMCTISFKDLKEVICSKSIPPEVSMAVLYYYIHVQSHEWPYLFNSDFKTLVSAVDAIKELIENQLAPSSQGSDHIEEVCGDAREISMVAHDFFEACSLKMDRELWRFVCSAVDVFVTASRVHHTFLVKSFVGAEKEREFQVESDRIAATFSSALECLNAWLYHCLPPVMGNLGTWSCVDELNIWSKLLSLEWPTDCTAKEWLRRELERKIDSIRLGKAKIDLFCSTDSKEYHHVVKECLSKAAFKAIETAPDIQFLFTTSYRHTDAYTIGSMLSHAFSKSWPRTGADDLHILQHAFTWPAFPQYLKCRILRTRQRTAILSEDCQIRLAEVSSLLHKTVKDVENGTVQICMLELVLKNKDSFLGLCRIIEDVEKEALQEGQHQKSSESGQSEMKQSKVDQLDIILQHRLKEMEAFESIKQFLGIFSELCKRIQPVNTDALDRRLRQDISCRDLSDICEPYIMHPDVTQNWQPAITFFDQPSEVSDMMMPLKEIHTSHIFTRFWKEFGSIAHKEKLEGTDEETDVLSLQEVATEVWGKAFHSWENLAKSIKLGTVTFGQMDEYFASFKDKYPELKDEFDLMGNILEDARWIDGRLDQVKQYHKLHEYRYGAQVMMDAKKELGLTGDFSLIEILVDAGAGKENQLSSINSKVVDAGKVLIRVDNTKSDCIKDFVKCSPLVNWLRENIKGTKELNVLVELAMIQAGETDMEVDRVSILHDAAIGFAPLIYEVQTDCDFHQFLHQCELVWNALDNDKDLPVKLRDTMRHLDWVKMIKDSHGSVEVSSLAQAEAINSRGIYQVGNLRPDQPKTMETTIKLVVPPDPKAYGKRNEEDVDSQDDRPVEYTFEKLNDLQSKLMLVAGKVGKVDHSKAEVDKFVEVFDAIGRLAKAYLKICAAGSVLFNDWTSKFFCDLTKPWSTIISFGLAEQELRGKPDRLQEEGLSTQIRELCEFMENCYEDWLKYIEKQRCSYYELNFFTTEQLVILRREMAKLGLEGQRPSDLIYPMLHNVKANSTKQDLLKVMKTAVQDLQEMEKQRNTEEQNDAEMTEELLYASEMPDDVEEKQKVETFLEAVKEAGYPENLALMALQNCGPEDVVEGLLWCMDNWDAFQRGQLQATTCTPAGQDHQVDIEEVDLTFARLSAGMSMGTLAAELLQSTLGKKQKSSLKDQLEELWGNFFGKVATSVSDYLSIEHLGLMLTHLARLEPVKLERTFPETCLQKGRPNLLVCPQADILNAVLSVYMLDPTKPLPAEDEVLVCTAKTTVEEVLLLLNRAVQDDSGKIYCLVNADMLDYEVTEKAEEKLVKRTTDYQLVVLCSSEREDKARLVSALDRYRVQSPLIYPVREIQNYLKQQFQRVPEGPLKPVSSLDIEKCCVRVVMSTRAGAGKTLVARRLAKQVKTLNPSMQRMEVSITIPLQEKTVNYSAVLSTLLNYTPTPGQTIPRLFHLDIAHEVQEGVDNLLFNLLVLGALVDEKGYIWRKSPWDLYVIETLPLMMKQEVHHQRGHVQPSVQFVHHILTLLPSVKCRSPKESLYILINDRRKPHDCSAHDKLMDDTEFRSVIFQRPFQYLHRMMQGQGLGGVNPRTPEKTHAECLQVLLRYCGIEDPSWAELRHFVWFLNTQLQDCENSNFCSAAASGDLPGFLQFVVRFMIQMSRDFATRSLDISEQTPGHQMWLAEEEEEDVLARFQLKRRWELSSHPYTFFNADGHSMTFMGFNINQNGDIVDNQTNQIIERGVMPAQLKDALMANRVPLNENFDNLPRLQKIIKLCSVMGLQENIHDPDTTYELTTDNVKKMLAIHMRFRCGIPVVIMGETGCGKTRLIKFLCDLQKPVGTDIQNMILMKVHGGTTHTDIAKKVTQAMKIAQENNRCSSYPIHTVLFFDEANTTEAIGLIKEVMCDGTLSGKQLPLNKNGLKIIAACNPYRRHSTDMIRRLEQSGLGYHIEAENTKDKLGHVPMRQLVYRVQALPQSMLPLVWDFGQLSAEVEELYIRQIVQRYLNSNPLPNLPGLQRTISAVLAASQKFMREQEDECSFVSLRDIERVMNVMTWFYSHGNHLWDLMDERAERDLQEKYRGQEDVTEITYDPPDGVTRSLLLALGVCYHACLQKRKEYRDEIAQVFTAPCSLPDGATTIKEEIVRCQDVILDQVQLGDNIARNQALKENVFMMVVCIELRIPLFLVGKPGSSKSLAKTIVSDAMQGASAHSELFKSFKQVRMGSFQCSPLATPEGIVGTFRQCAHFQKDKNLDEFVSVVVLDEVGLAEDSPRMPLKTLHPLLEDGSDGDDKPEPYKKVAFIGISNWALDPAKMNRGILVQRGVPDDMELTQTARDICSSDELVQNWIEPYISPMSNAYLTLYERSTSTMREFFGLRDFYSLVKMVYAFAADTKKHPSWHQLKHAIKRNFGGLDTVKPEEEFAALLPSVNKNEPVGPDDPDNSPSGLIRASLTGRIGDSESRYLLILTENYAALSILQHHLLNVKDTIIIFGSSFPRDQEYTQVCRNINRIKVCMETGRSVVLLNLENLYESLYDALNQYYVYMGGQRFVDLGLGTHRVKCRVHKDFRLIVVAEKQIVYKKFPIPLINRLEKHFLAMTTMLTPDQIKIVEKVQQWVQDFTTLLTPAGHGQTRNRDPIQPSIGDVFIGYHDDTAASVVFQVCSDINQNEGNGDLYWEEKVLSAAQYQLLQCATPEAVVRLKDTKLRALQEGIWDQYFKQQKHESLLEYLHNEIMEKKPRDSVFVQVTTHSKLLSIDDEKEIAKVLKLPPANVRSLALQNFGTEQEFGRKIRRFFNDVKKNDTLLLVQCDSGDQNGSLIACARYCVMDEFAQARKNMGSKIHVVFVVQLPRVSGGCFVGFQGGKWLSVHIDDLRPETYQLPSWGNMMGNSIGTLFTQSVHQGRTHGPQSGIITRQDLAERIEQLQKREQAPHPSDSGIVLESEVNNTDEDSLMDTSESQFSRDVEMENRRASTPKKENSVQVDPGEELPTTDVRMEEDVERMEVEDHESDLRGLDYSALIRNCVQGAAAMLKEEHAENAQRTTERIQILLKLLSIRKMKGQDCRTFAEVVGRRVASLLSEKEEKVMRPGRAVNWLRNEAASMDMIHKAGTFRRSSWQCIQQKVTPMLAGIVALMDTNSNLNILHAHQDLTHWMHQFWLELLDNENATELKYQRDLRSPKLNAELTEMVVRTIGCGQMFCNQLPFSWVIYQQVEKMLHQVKKLDQVNQLQKTQELFEEWHTGKIVTNYMNKAQNVAEDILDLYLTDFVHMIHKESSDGECQVMVHALRSAAFETRQRFYNEQAVSMLPEKEAERFHQAMKFDFTIPVVHLAYHSVQSRLQHLRQLFHLLPDLAASLLNDIGKSQKNEMNIDVLGLTYCLENLEPHTEPLENQNQRNGWLDKVQRFKPTVERILQSVCQDSYHYGDKSRYQLLQCRYIWNRLLALHLFVEHVCPRGVKQEDLTVKRCMPFWKMLSREEKTDFKEVPSMEKVKKFLVSCNTSASKHFFGELEECKYCKQPMQNPVKLPCGHIFCHACLQGRRYADINECPERGCRKMFGEVKELKTMSDFRDKIKAHNEYKRSCNTFFMALVSQLCFNEDTPPEPDVVRMLLSCVTKESQLKSGKSGTKDFNLFDVCIDPSPVIRSFLLQLLLRSDMEQVKQYLQEYFDQARKFTQDGSQTLELCMLCIQCMEDSFHNKISQHGSSLTARASMVTAYLKRARLMIGGSIKEIDCIEAIALSRFGLAVTADIMFSVFVESGRKLPVSRELKELFDAAGNLCDQVRWAKIFLVKQICRVHGTEALQTITEVPYLARWILPPEARQKVHDDKDMYLICGQLYEHLRETVTKVVLGESVALIQEVLDGSNDGVPLKETSMLLALYREVTTSYIHGDPNRLPSQEVLQNLVQYYHQLSIFQMKTFCQKILSNQIGQGCPELTITRGQDRLHQQMSALVIHAMVIYSVKCTTVRQKGILEPFLKMFQKPQDMNTSYFPTMPQDELSEIREAVHSGRTGGQADTLWVCPNGHPYVIGDCGRPAVEAQCQTCGIKIGGMGHNPAQGNVKAREDDQTQPGHILGNASTRNTTSEPMRGISAVQAAILRMITHITMFVAANRDPQGVASLIKGVNLANGVNTFLWQHIQADIQTLSRTIRKSPEDCVLMMHMIIQNILINETSADRSSGWGNKQSRQTWEAEFARVFITPIVSGLENKLNNANQYMAKDERLGNNPLIKLVYETERVDTGRDVLQVDKLAEEPEVWRFRSRITINNVTQELSEFMTSRRGQKPHQLLILQAFLQKEHSLRMLRYLPSILKLQRLLSQGHQRRVNKNEAMSITIKEMLEKMVEGPEKMEMQTLIKCFKEVWYTVREEIAAKGVKVANGILRVPKEQCRMQIEGSTPLSILLPNSRGHGVCSLALVRHLINLQNDFLEEHYWKYRKNAIPEDVVQPKDLIVSHIISYHPEHDLMPLILASCNYSYKISPTSAGSTRQESELQYDYDALGKQIEERFLKGKVRLGGQLDTITFREDTTHARVFRDLEEKIPQEPLSHQVKHQIVSELRDFQDISDSLVALDLSAEFLVTVGGEPGSKIAEFMQNTLSLETGLKSAKARQHCSLSHVKSLWLVLAYEQAKHLTKRKQDSFHILDDRYREKLSPEQVVVLAEALKHLNTETFLCELFEFIVLYVCDKREVAMDEDAVEIADDRLGHQLYSYIDSKDGPEIPSLVQEDGFPENFQVKHCDHIWKETLKMMTNPESQF